MHPVLFTVFGIPISPYGLLIAVGLLTGVFLARRMARRAGIPEDAVLDVVFWGVILGFVGARLAFILVEFPGFLRDPSRYLFSRQGFVFLGGLLTAIPVTLYIIRRWGVRFGAMADILTPPLALAHAFGRAGCFFAGCCHGAISNAPWAVEFPRVVQFQSGAFAVGACPLPVTSPEVADSTGRVVGEVIGSPAFYDQAQAGARAWSDTHALAVHPTQIYDVVIQLALFALLMALWPRRRFHGQIFLIYLWIYPITRIVLEFFRGDLQRGIWFGGISTSQLLSGLIVLAALILTLLRRRLFDPVELPAQLSAPDELPANEHAAAKTG